MLLIFVKMMFYIRETYECKLMFMYCFLLFVVACQYKLHQQQKEDTDDA